MALKRPCGELSPIMLFIIWKPQLNCDHISLWETNASFYNLAVGLSVVLVDSVKCTLLAVSWSFPGGVRYTYCTTYIVYSTVMVIWWYSISKCWLCGLGCNLMLLVSVLECVPSSSLCTCSSLSMVVPHLKPLLLSGYLIGYLVHRKKDLPPICAASVLPFEEAIPHETGAAPLMDWEDVKKLLAQKVNAGNFEPVFR